MSLERFTPPTTPESRLPQLLLTLWVLNFVYHGWLWIMKGSLPAIGVVLGAGLLLGIVVVRLSR